MINELGSCDAIGMMSAARQGWVNIRQNASDQNKDSSEVLRDMAIKIFVRVNFGTIDTASGVAQLLFHVIQRHCGVFGTV
jgi:hypothetical protein